MDFVWFYYRGAWQYLKGAEPPCVNAHIRLHPGCNYSPLRLIYHISLLHKGVRLLLCGCFGRRQRLWVQPPRDTWMRRQAHPTQPLCSGLHTELQLIWHRTAGAEYEWTMRPVVNCCSVNIICGEHVTHVQASSSSFLFSFSAQPDKRCSVVAASPPCLPACLPAMGAYAHIAHDLSGRRKTLVCFWFHMWDRYLFVIWFCVLLG